MLAEAIHYLLTPASRRARRLGYVTGSVALWARGRRCRAAWADHERRSRAVVAGVVERLPRRRTALVLGSGLCRDVDVPFLAARFASVVLVDVVHPASVRLALRGIGHLRFVEADLTGFADLLDGRPGPRGAPLAAFAADPRIDLVVSANLLSQLPLTPMDRVEETPSLHPAGAEAFGAAIVAGHLADLAGFGADVRVVLLTDVEMVERDPAGRETDRIDLMRGVALPPPAESWDWPVAPAGELRGGVTVVHRVHAHPDFRAAVAAGEPTT